MSIPLSDAEKPSAQSTPSEESPSILVNGVGSGVVNGHIPLRKRFIESSLDELAMELEAYEQGEQKPKAHDDHVNDTQETEDLHTEPELSPVVIATDEAETSRDTEQMEDESERAIVELLKLSGEVGMVHASYCRRLYFKRQYLMRRYSWIYQFSNYLPKQWIIVCITHRISMRHSIFCAYVSCLS